MPTHVIFYDPGKVTGWGIYGEHGCTMSGQGTLRQVLAETIPWIKLNEPPIVGVEKTFVGPGKRASLDVTEDLGFIKGALWCAGYRGEIFMPVKGSWMSALSLLDWAEGPDGKKVRPTDDELEERALAHARALVEVNLTKAQIHQAEGICGSQVTWERWLERAAA